MTRTLLLAITELPNLLHLHLGRNYFSSQISPKYGLWQHLEYLAVSGNELDGTIPPGIGNLTSLWELYIGYYNTYTGGIAPEIRNLTELVRLDVRLLRIIRRDSGGDRKTSKTRHTFLQVIVLSGSLTWVLGNLKNLKSMDLSNNVLIGEIPTSFSQLKNLTLLNLFRNKLHGAIQEFIGDMPALEVVQLWENNFTRNILMGLGSNGKLTLLDLSSNKLTRTLPPYLCSGNRLQTLNHLMEFVWVIIF